MIYIDDLFSILPNIILYIVTGFFFIKTFHFIALKQNTEDVEHLLLESLVSGYVYCQLLFLVPIRFSHYVNIIGAVIGSIILAYLLGKLYTSTFTLKTMRALKLYDTGNTYMWDDLMDKEYAIKVIVEYDDRIYNGFLNSYESYSNSPHLTLCLYTVSDLHGKIIEDHTDDIRQVIVLDSSIAKNVIIRYDKESKVCDDIKSFL